MLRKTKRLVVSLAGIAAISTAALFISAIAHADEPVRLPEDEKDLARLAAIWQGNLSEVQTAHLLYRSVLRFPAKKVAREGVLALLASTDVVGTPDDVRLISDALELELKPEKPAWGYAEMYLAGSALRINDKYEGFQHSEGVFTDRVHVRYKIPNDQIDIWYPQDDRSAHKRFANFRVIPQLTDPSVATIESRSADELVVKLGATQFVVDERTGFVKSKREYSSELVREIIQVGKFTYPGGIVFPEAVITCHYRHGNLTSIGIDVIEGAAFNHAIPDKVFAISAPAGAKVFDHRLSPYAPERFTRLQGSVPDVLSAIDKRLGAVFWSVDPTRASSHTILLKSE
jgi:hypothetical protein